MKKEPVSANGTDRFMFADIYLVAQLPVARAVR